MVLAACRLCSSGWPPGCPPHSTGQHYACWADSSLAATKGPAWEVVVSADPPDGWTPPEGWRDVDVFVRSLPPGVQVVWRRLPRPG